MGSTGSDHNTGNDFKVGALVWVRRRNGSWWPGKILSPNELPDGRAAIPRSGTPVKLLGKKGTTVDWYNLEKSKRIKAFRSGEYEDCIEKARVSASRITKKGVRKARREDAIRHALELESALLLKDNPKASAAPLENGRAVGLVYGPISEPNTGEIIEHQDLHISEHLDINHRAAEVDLSFEEQEMPKNGPVKRKTPNDSEEDVGVKRMRGLEDLGVGIRSSLKRKRSQIAYESLKKKNRHRPLTKVLESSTMLSSPHEQFPCANGLSDEVLVDHYISGFEVNESINSVSIVIKNEEDSMGFLCSNGILRDASMQPREWMEDNLSFVQGDDESCENLFDVPLVSEGMPAVVSDASQSAQLGDSAHSNQSTLVETPSFGSGEKVSGSTNSTSHPHQITLTMEKSASDWQTKGKRNSRARKLDTDDENICSWNEKERNPSGSKAEAAVASQKLLPQCLSSTNKKHDSVDFSLSGHFSDSCLCNVVVKVKSGIQPQNVPCVSLMSKMNNLPISGQSLNIEILEDGSCNDLVIDNMHEDTPVDEQQGMGLPFKLRSSKSFISRAKSRKSRKNGMLSKKTRKLSTLTGTRGFPQHARKPGVKTHRSPIASCIPLKVVFSRISASLSGPPRPVQHLVETSGIELPQ